MRSEGIDRWASLPPGRHLRSAGLTCLISLVGMLGFACESASPEARDIRPERVEGVALCDLPREILIRLQRGYFPGRSGDVLAVEWAPNQFAGRRHSTPFPYTQNVPLLLYGPGFVKEGQQPTRDVTVVDLAPTFARLLQFDDFPKRHGTTLKEALLMPKARKGVPKLIVTVVWDGGGDDLLEQWPNAWPNLKRLRDRATYFKEATVGSSPSITPPIHSNIGTGAFPSMHGQPDMFLRIKGKIHFIWDDLSPRFLRVPTLGDLWDRANGNKPVVGAVARSSYHLGMLGHGAAFPGGDHDVAVIDRTEEVGFNTNAVDYRLPPYVSDSGDLDAAVDEVDQRDGATDGTWLGNPISAADAAVRATPAWPIYQTQIVKAVLKQEGFGKDQIPDLLYVNYKSTDLAGHRWSLAEPEERDVLREQDRQLANLIRTLDKRIGERNYVLALTADHGISPDPSTTGGWTISGDELVNDIHAAFDHENPDDSLVQMNRGYQIFLDKAELRANDATPGDISAFIRNYRIEDNGSLADSGSTWEGRGTERVFLTALTPGELGRALECTD